MTRLIPRKQLEHLLWTPESGLPPAPSPMTVPTSTSFALASTPDRYVFSPISYQGGLYQVSLSKSLLDEGREHTQDKWSEVLHDNEWRLPSGPLMMALMTQLYVEREGVHKDLVAEVQTLLQEDFRKYWMMTSTCIKYSSRGTDEVVHDYKQPDAYPVSAKIVGPDDWVTPTSGFEDSIEALLGTRDLAMLEQVSEWGSKKKPYLWRYNNTPEEDDERALVLGVNVNGNGFSINAYVNIDVNRPARGVAVQKIFQ